MIIVISALISWPSWAPVELGRAAQDVSLGLALVFVLYAFGGWNDIALFVLRVRDKGRKRPFSTPFYPLPPIVFCLTCLFMLHAGLAYAKGLTWWRPLRSRALGPPLYFLTRASKESEPRASEDRPASNGHLAAPLEMEMGNHGAG